MNSQRPLLVLLCLWFAAAASAQEPPAEWVEATGHRVVRLSTEPGSSSFYFHQNPYTAAGDKMVIGTKKGLAAIDLKTRKNELIVEGKTASAVVGRKSRQVYYTRGKA